MQCPLRRTERGLGATKRAGGYKYPTRTSKAVREAYRASEQLHEKRMKYMFDYPNLEVRPTGDVGVEIVLNAEEGVSIVIGVGDTFWSANNDALDWFGQMGMVKAPVEQEMPEPITERQDW